MRTTLLRHIIMVASILASTALRPLVASGKSNKELTAFDTYQTYESVYPDRWRGLPDYPLEQSVTDTKNEEIRYFASRFALLDDVPYVWGGGRAKVQSPQKCQECRECIGEGKFSSHDVYTSCKSCQSCGIDCSHLVTQVLRDSGLPVPYGSTEELLARSADDLARLYHVEDLGDDYVAAATGDILIFRGHEVLVLENHNNGFATIVHSAAFKKGSRYGGIIIEDIDLGRYAGGIKRILRHQILASLNKSAPRPFRLTSTGGLAH